MRETFGSQISKGSLPEPVVVVLVKPALVVVVMEIPLVPVAVVIRFVVVGATRGTVAIAPILHVVVFLIRKYSHKR